MVMPMKNIDTALQTMANIGFIFSPVNKKNNKYPPIIMISPSMKLAIEAIPKSKARPEATSI
jgi:hypothetical protein